MYRSKVLTNYLIDDSNGIQHARMNLALSSSLLSPALESLYSVKIIAVITIIAMIYHLLKGDSTCAYTNQPNW